MFSLWFELLRNKILVKKFNIVCYSHYSRKNIYSKVNVFKKSQFLCDSARVHQHHPVSTRWQWLSTACSSQSEVSAPTTSVCPHDKEAQVEIRSAADAGNLWGNDTARFVGALCHFATVYTPHTYLYTKIYRVADCNYMKQEVVALYSLEVHPHLV